MCNGLIFLACEISDLGEFVHLYVDEQPTTTDFFFQLSAIQHSNTDKTPIPQVNTHDTTGGNLKSKIKTMNSLRG